MRRSTVNIILWTIVTLVIIIVVAEIVALDYSPIGISNYEPSYNLGAVDRFRSSYNLMKSNLLTIIRNIIN